MENNIIVYTDGGSRGNPGPAASGVVISKNGTVIKKIGKTLGITTNNVAEYTAVIEGLQWISKNAETIGEYNAVHFFMDSLLLCQQLKRIYKIKQPHLQSLMFKIRQLESEITAPISYTHVRREQNKAADAMVNLALDNLL
ncbi:MAG: ribonuclease HI family protein [Patescibacteria group bacterium]|nr:ribonuclease HI family protein [Patescibacteria group bacterium]MDE2588734.1 ribonuclease HI family protein [Patescibacteria group bacterium]